MLWICKENLCVLLSDSSLCSGQTRDRHTERRAGHIVQTDLVAELYGAGVTAVLTADTAVQLGTGSFTVLHSHLHQLANAVTIQLGEGIVLKDLGVIVSVQELTGVITAEAVGHLGQVVGAEAEELSFFCHFVGGEASSKKTSSVANFLSWYHILEHMKNKA